MKKSLIGIVLILMIPSLVGGSAFAQSSTYVDPPVGYAGPVYEMPRMPLPEAEICPAPDENWIRAHIIVRDEDERYKHLNLNLCPTTGKLQALVPELITPYDQLWWLSRNPEVATVARHEVPDAGYNSTATVRPVSTGITCVFVVVRHEDRIYYDFARIVVSSCADEALTGSGVASAGTSSTTANVAGETIAAAAEGSKDAATGEPVEVAAGEPAAAAGTNSTMAFAGIAIGALMVITLLFIRRRQSAS